MNHQKIYDAIISKAKSENRIKLKRNEEGYVYYEKHHILPKCLGGIDDKENLVLLTAKEHYVCHKLLTYIYKNNYKIMAAFHRMTFDRKDKHYISSNNYAYAKELRSMIPMSKEQKQKISEKLKGRKLTKETCIKMSNSKKGVSAGRGRKLSAEHIYNIIKARTGTKRTDETKEKLRTSSLNVKKITCEHCEKEFSPWGLVIHKRSKQYINNKIS